MTKPIDETDYATCIAVSKARRENLSQAVRDLVAVAPQGQQAEKTREFAKAISVLWNRFNLTAGSFADEHSTL